MITVLILVLVLMIVVAFSDGEMTKGWGEKRSEEEQAKAEMAMRAYQAGLRDGLKQQRRTSSAPDTDVYEMGADGVYRPVAHGSSRAR